MDINEKQKKFINDVKFYEELKRKMEEVREDLDKQMFDLGIGNYIQDPATLTVYKIVKPSGTFISFKEISYVRTSEGDEKKGTLSKKEAEGAGFVLK